MSALSKSKSVRGDSEKMRKLHQSRRRAAMVLAVGSAVAPIMSPARVRAASTTYYFDVNGTLAGSGVSNNGNYTWGNGNWTTQNTGTAATGSGNWSSNTANNAVFVATSDASSNAFTVNLAADEWVGALTVNSGVPTIAVGSHNFVLGGNSTWNIATGSTLNVTGNGGSWGALNMNGNALTVGDGGNMTVAGLGNSGAGLTMNGNGTLTISAADNFAGATTINSGTVSLTALAGNNTTGAPATELKSSAVTINAGATLSANSATSGLNSHQLGNLTLNGGMLASNGVSGNSDYNFAFKTTTITAGNSTTSTISASIGLYGNNTINVGNGSTLNITGDVGNWEGQAWGTIIKTGSGLLSLTYNGNGYGGLILNAGTVSVGNGSFGNSGSGSSLADFEGNSTLQWGGTNNTFDVSGGKMKIADGVAATLDTNGNNVTLGTAIVVGANKTGALTLNDSAATPGKLILTANETYTGNTTITNGTLQIGSGGTTGSLASTHIVDNANLAYSYNGATTASLPSSALSGSGNLSATAGVIQFNGNIALGGTESFTQNSTSGYYHGLNVAGNTTLTASSISLTGDLGNKNTGTTLSLDTSAANGPINLNISVGSSGVWYGLGGLTANAGTGNLSISGNYTNGYGFYAGPTSLTGALSISSTSLLLNNSLTLHATATSTISGNIALGAATNTINVDNNVGMTVSGVLSGGGDGITKTGAGSMQLSGVNTYTGSTTVSAGTLQIASAGTLGSGNYSGNISISTNGTFEYCSSGNQTFAGVISGNGPLIKDTSALSVLTLSGNNSYTGQIAVNAGTVIAGISSSGSNGAFGSGNVTLGAGSGNLSASVLTGGAFTVSNPINVAFGSSGNTLTVGGNADNNSTFSGPITLNNNLTVSQVTNTGSNALSITGGITGGTSGPQTVTFAGPGNITVSSTAITDGSAGNTTAVAVTGGTTTFGTNESYSGGTTVSAGTLMLYDVNNSGSGGSGSISGNLTINSGGIVNAGTQWALGYSGTSTSVTNIAINGGTLQFGANGTGGGGTSAANITMQGGNITPTTAGNGFDVYGSGTTFTVNSGLGQSTISANMNLRLGSGNATFNVADTTDAVGLLVSGNVGAAGGNAGGNVVKTGAGEMDLTGLNSYSGTTFVQAGTLRTTNLSGPLVVGTGSPNSGAIAVGPNATTAGTLALSSTSATHTWNGGGTYQWKIIGAGTGGVAAGTGDSGQQGLGNNTFGGQEGQSGYWDLITTASGSTLDLSSLSGNSTSTQFTIAPIGNITSGATSYSWVIAQAPAGGINLPGGYTIPNGGNSSADLTNGGAGGPFVLSTAGIMDSSNSPLNASEFSLEAVNIGSHEDLVLDYSGTPEPGTTILVLGGAVPMLMGRRRRTVALR